MKIKMFSPHRQSSDLQRDSIKSGRTGTNKWISDGGIKRKRETHPSVLLCLEGRLERQRLYGRCQKTPCQGRQYPSSQSSSLGWWWTGETLGSLLSLEGSQMFLIIFWKSTFIYYKAVLFCVVLTDTRDCWVILSPKMIVCSEINMMHWTSSVWRVPLSLTWGQFKILFRTDVMLNKLSQYSYNQNILHLNLVMKVNWLPGGHWHSWTLILYHCQQNVKGKASRDTCVKCAPLWFYRESSHS